MKYKSEVDVAVLLIFFNRDEQFSQVFKAVKEARPSKLYLYQDGSRGRQDDRDVLRCREIAEDIDWECEVHKMYQDINMGCDPSEYIAQKWMFETEDKGIILEDDDVPSKSFFRFCKELLDRYEDDQRIHMVCGMNSYDVNERTEDSYFFSHRGSIWGWATWKRVIDLWDEKYLWLDDPRSLCLLKENLHPLEYRRFVRTSRRHRDSGRAHYESIAGAALYLNNQVNIVPKHNLISNVGIGKGTHSQDNMKLYPKKTQKLFYKKTYEIEFPLRHPKYVVVDQGFDRLFDTGLLELAYLVAETKLRKVLFGNRLFGMLKNNTLRGGYCQRGRQVAYGIG